MEDQCKKCQLRVGRTVLGREVDACPVFPKETCEISKTAKGVIARMFTKDCCLVPPDFKIIGDAMDGLGRLLIEDYPCRHYAQSLFGLVDACSLTMQSCHYWHEAQWKACLEYDISDRRFDIDE